MYTILLHDTSKGTYKTLIQKWPGENYQWEIAPRPSQVVQFRNSSDAQLFLDEYMSVYDTAKYEYHLVHFKPKGPRGLYRRYR